LYYDLATAFFDKLLMVRVQKIGRGELTEPLPGKRESSGDS
jgi:hypothetical protein